MTTTTYQGAPQFPTVLGSIRPSTREEMDTAIEALQSHKDEWVAFSIYDRIMLIDRMIKDFAAIASRWVDASIQAKGISEIHCASVKNGLLAHGQYSKIYVNCGNRWLISKWMGILKYLDV